MDRPRRLPIWLPTARITRTRLRQTQQNTSVTGPIEASNDLVSLLIGDELQLSDMRPRNPQLPTRSPPRRARLVPINSIRSSRTRGSTIRSLSSTPLVLFRQVCRRVKLVEITLVDQPVKFGFDGRLVFSYTHVVGMSSRPRVKRRHEICPRSLCQPSKERCHTNRRAV